MFSAASPRLPCRGAGPCPKHFLDLVERLAPEVGRAQHLGLGLLDEVADVDDVVVLEAVGRAHRQLQLVHLLERSGLNSSPSSRAPAEAGLGLVEVEEDRQLVLEDPRGIATASSGVSAPFVSSFMVSLS
jgi:hypothetical protein